MVLSSSSSSFPTNQADRKRSWIFSFSHVWKCIFTHTFYVELRYFSNFSFFTSNKYSVKQYGNWIKMVIRLKLSYERFDSALLDKSDLLGIRLRNIERYRGKKVGTCFWSVLRIKIRYPRYVKKITVFVVDVVPRNVRFVVNFSSYRVRDQNVWLPPASNRCRKTIGIRRRIKRISGNKKTI